MDSYHNDKHFDYDYIKRNQITPVRPPSNSFATAANVLGIIAIVTAIFGTVYPPFILGGLAIILGWLSHGGEERLSKLAKTGIITASIGLVLNLVVITISIYAVFTVPEYKQELNRIYEEIYGQSFDEAWDEMLKESSSPYPGGDF